MNQWILRSLINSPALFPLPYNGHLSHEVSANTDCNGVWTWFDCLGERAQSPDAMILSIPLHLFCYLMFRANTMLSSHIWNWSGMKGGCALYRILGRFVFIQSNVQWIKVNIFIISCIPWELNPWPWNADAIFLLHTIYYSHFGIDMLQKNCNL